MSLKLLFIFMGLIFFLSGCAASNPTRSLASRIDSAASSLNDMPTNGTPASTWNNGSQKQKGVIIGGATGALAGGVFGMGWLPAGAVGAVFGGAMGAWIDSETTIIDQLENRGVNIFILGDYIRIVLPALDLFTGNSAFFNSSAPHTLDLVAMLVASYPNQAVAVVAYADPRVQNPKRLTKEQAHAVMKYLWNAGIDTRLLYAEGAGGSKPVVNSGFNNDNNRIEITLKKLPV